MRWLCTTTFLSFACSTYDINRIAHAPQILLILTCAFRKDRPKANVAADVIELLTKCCRRICPNIQFQTLVTLLQFTAASLTQLCTVVVQLYDLVCIFITRQYNHNNEMARTIPKPLQTSFDHFQSIAGSNSGHIQT
jgi:hypothetical protein